MYCASPWFDVTVSRTKRTPLRTRIGSTFSWWACPSENEPLAATDQLPPAPVFEVSIL